MSTKENIKVNENIAVNESKFNEKNTTKFNNTNTNFNERTNNALNQQQEAINKTLVPFYPIAYASHKKI